MRALRLLLASLASFAVACGGGDSTNNPGDGGGDPTTDGGGGGPDGGGPPPGSYTVTFGPLEVQGGTEDTRCVIKRLGNTEQLRVGQIHNVLGESSHHFIVYRTNETVEQPDPFPCDPFVDTLDPAAGSPLMITQKADELLTLPQGVAFTLAADVLVRLEMHYINAGDDPVNVEASATFIPIPDAEFEHEADFLFIGNPDIDIPPMSTATLGPTFFPLPSNLAASNFFGITGHTHQWGTNVYVETAPSEGGAGTPVYDVTDWSWDEPETVYADPPFTVPAGGGFRFTCDWNNMSDQPVGFGESASDEMCFFWAYYYPSQGAFVCAHTDQFGGFDICCPGSPICDQLF